MLSPASQRSVLGVPRPSIINSEAALITELQTRKRPVADVEFTESNSQTTQVGALRVGDLLLTETYTDPLIFKSTQEPQLSFVIPLSGTGSVRERTQSVQWNSTHHILQLTYAHSIEAHSDKSHVVAIVPKIEKVAREIAALPSAPERPIEKITSAWTEVHQGVFNGVDYYRQMRELINIVGFANGDEDFLQRIGIDDVFTKLLAEMLVAKEASDPAQMHPPVTKRSERAVDIICHHVASNIGSPLTISKMEKLTGLTGRALNYAFQSRFNCSPQEWQRNYLLDEARSRLLQGSPCVSVKAIAFSLGFSSTSSFASHYKKRFGNLPSNTITGFNSLPRLNIGSEGGSSDQ